MRTHKAVRPAAGALAMAGGLVVGLGATADTPTRAATRCPMISARLGLHWPYSSFPENSAAAIHAAHRAGAPKLEVDVNYSRDGVPMAVHDEHIDRVTAHTGRVSAYSAATLKTFRLKVKGGHGSTWMSNERLLSLYGALYHARAHDMRVSVEIKPSRLSAAQAHAVALRFAWLNDWTKVDVRSYYRPVLRAIRRANPRIHTTLIVHRPTRRGLPGNVMESINFNRHGTTIKGSTVRALHAAGYQVDAYTPDTWDEFATVPLAVDQITTNNVKGARAFLGAHGC
jgi:glycerophosphoryl diester phosphodiesterase